MKAALSMEIVIIIILLFLVALLVLYWLGLIQNPFEWLKKNELKMRFCAEVQERTTCQTLQVADAHDLNIDENTPSLRIRKKEVGLQGGDDFASYGEICTYLGYDIQRSNAFNECLARLCGCKISSVR